ncbi:MULTISPECIES: AAA family ATPase [Cupriavidus]|uniref:ATPase exported protein n=3 Tax=Cupriavidus TaxID=106589 RepID=A0A375D9T4_9BURK|nr:MULTISPECIES: DUF3696 domain-containing protein [Cupriavidus]MCO4865704.1 DUF3696 domain-containing protein [Cupriavidus sp. WGlv3]MCO4893472.1 DUF3696 domain-containing protein [Cupriavidus sp. WGtm5]CAP64276.1 putative ATPase; putative exported protein [Cupriavidus taiwanensis LMG 19424]SOY73752.1 putative ATPase; putative exported protein [Cupriavidus taiwanensis]SOY73982.1 putative ATPase; putative exported protein [Cupriavidus taiwanensis]
MIKTLDIENFKCFSSLRLRFGALTLLTGFNAGGKSSAVQPLLLLAQALRTSASAQKLPLNGPIVHLGTVGDVLPANASGSSLAFKVAGVEHEVTWTTSARASERHLEVTESRICDVAGSTNTPPTEAIKEPSTEVCRSITGLSYLSAVRDGLTDAYPMPESDEEVTDVGADGRFAPYWYDRYVDDEVQVARRHPGEPASSLRKQVDAWLATLFPHAQANVHHVPQVSLESLQFRISDFGAWRRPANVGYGFTYAFPILIALLAANDGQMIVIDSPEAHLHPFAQSQMGRLLAHFAAAGLQVVVETHSDHLLNGVRLAVKEGLLPPDELCVHFFSGTTETGHGVLTLAVDNEGRIASWPEGFFDQSEKDLARLSGWE